jgi:Flp pilus assembly protein TadG
MILVAVAMVAIIAMAALSIDVITLYLAREEAQRSADQAALAAARVISLSGITGDPTNASGYWSSICAPAGSATQAATAVAKLGGVGNVVPTTVSVTYLAGNGSGGFTSNSDCSSLATSAFGVNPMVTVTITRPSLPTFFSRIWGNGGSNVSATAAAEAFNPSNSGAVGGSITPVQPRCVKPWLVPNQDPLYPQPNGINYNNYCNQSGVVGGCRSLVGATDGSITHPGISLGVSNGANGVIGETFWLSPDCDHTGTGCTLRSNPNPPAANYYRPGFVQGPPNLQFVPGPDPTATPVALPSWATGMDPYEQAIAGCDVSTVYQCGVQNMNTVDLAANPGANPDYETADAVQPLIREADLFTLNDGQDSINNAGYPFQILAGSATPLSGLSGNAITSSASVVSLPIYDSAATTVTQAPASRPVTIIGFLQVFINQVDQYGNVSVTVMNVAGCGNGTNSTNNPVTGSSPVPVRLITPP